MCHPHAVRVVTFSFLCPLSEKYGTFIARCNALIEKVSSFRPFLDDDSIVIIHDWFLEEWGYAFLDDGSQDLSKPVRLPPRHSLPSYRRALDYYDVVATVSPHKQPTRCTRAGLVVLRKKREHGGTGPSR
eukprot:SAG31_NODE_1417_length_8440_cov_7.706510_2_plen_130_part_00